MSQKLIIVEDQFIEANNLRLMLVKEGYIVCGIADTVLRARELVEKEKPDLVLIDIFLKGDLTGIDLATQLKKEGIPFIYISANSNEEVLNMAKATHPAGFLVKPFRKKDVLVTLEIAKYKFENSKEVEFKQEALFEKQLNTFISGDTNSEEKLLQLAGALQGLIPFDFVSIGTKKNDHTSYIDRSFLRIGFDEYQLIGPEELMTIANLTLNELSGLQARTQLFAIPARYNENDFNLHCRVTPLVGLIADMFEICSHLFYPLLLASGDIGYLSFYSRRSDAYTPEHLTALAKLNIFLATAVERAIKPINSQSLTSLSKKSDSVLHTKPEPVKGFNGIVGSSHLLLNVFDQITQVAPSDTSVLILGESGTGKERIADSIHKLSPRADRPLIKINCAALPATLIESELFGHEKGSFTGATDKRIGKFEQADTGTIFLDEVGEMPVELQAKLLRVLQEKEIERIGGKSIIKINVRIIAATNKNLEKEVAEGRFRLDLYYRLNVFPILLPPLRERQEDIRELVTHFIATYSRKAGKTVTDISEKALFKLIDYPWPGNIRELEHLIERAVLLAKGSMIEDISLTTIQRKESNFQGDDARIKTIFENERDHIISVLKKCNSKIWGPGAAAEMLNIPPSTLKSKMKKLGIKKEY